MLFGDKIKELRVQHGLLQRQVASILDIDTPMYSKYERGERLPKEGQINQLATLFNTEERELRILCMSDRIMKTLSKDNDIKVDVINNVMLSINISKISSQTGSSIKHEDE